VGELLSAVAVVLSLGATCGATPSTSLLLSRGAEAVQDYSRTADRSTLLRGVASAQELCADMRASSLGRYSV